MVEWWDLTYRFFSFSDAAVRLVVAGTMLLGAAAGGLGTFVYLQKRSLVGDALAHAALPGVGLAFLILGEKQFLPLVVGAAVTAWLGGLAVDAVTRYTRLKLDAALGMVLSVFFGFGILILTHIQKGGYADQSGLAHFIFGKAAAMSPGDVTAIGVITLLLAVTLMVGFRHFKLVVFDPGFAASLGLPIRIWQFALTTLVVMAVTIGLQAVGVVLIAALLITPAAAARQWTDRLAPMIGLATAFGSLSGLLGAYISFLAPALPTGPWVVVVVSSIFAVSLLLAPNRGIVWRLLEFWGHRRKVSRDHILKALYRHGMDRGNWTDYYPRRAIAELWSFRPGELRSALGQLVANGSLERSGDMFRLTSAGIASGERITRLHRLWEVYLSRYLDLPSDHLHRDAEAMEHVISPELEAQLTDLLEHPTHDPHAQPIPYERAKGEAKDQAS